MGKNNEVVPIRNDDDSPTPELEPAGKVIITAQADPNFEKTNTESVMEAINSEKGIAIYSPGKPNP